MKIKKLSISDQIVNEIKQAIIKGKLKPGDKLPNERQLAENYGVSRIPVREALRILSYVGILDTRHGGGTYVSKDNTDFLIESLSTLLVFGKKPVIEMLELRIILETEAARLAALNVDENLKKQIKAAKEEVEEELKLLKKGINGDFSEKDKKFHTLIARASQNTLFEKFINSIGETLVIHQEYNILDEDSLGKIEFYHNGVYEGIRDGDPQKSSVMMREHLEIIKKLVLQRI
ncbi:MAG TPA: FadR family transcriptional regulator [Firmicutes bacterium]|nr:FadR family transcriptional regulator [Bacillota bacterium]